ncbi:MAG: hypothetical protein AAGH79_16085, partial [Bacteroidota bacterium]
QVHNAPSYNFSDLDPVDYLYLDLDEEYLLADDAPALVERLNLILTGGQLSEDAKASIINTLESLSSPVQRMRAALFLIFISPDYSIQK